MAEAVNSILDSRHPHSVHNGDSGGDKRRLKRHFSVHKFYSNADEFDGLKVYCASYVCVVVVSLMLLKI